MATMETSNFVERRNGPYTPAYEIPSEIANLLERVLNCKTGGSAKHGLRWEYKDCGVIFLENIKPTEVTIYILPTSFVSWWNPDILIKILSQFHFSRFINSIKTERSGKDLRIKGVLWEDAMKLLPILIEWSYNSQTGKSMK